MFVALLILVAICWVVDPESASTVAVPVALAPSFLTLKVALFQK